MIKEWSPAQELPFTIPQESVPEKSERISSETESSTYIVAEPGVIERDPPRVTLREVRATRSLLYNRLLLEAVQRRIEKAEAIILSYLLTCDSLSAQMGPYFVWLAEDNKVEALKTLSDDDWRQLHFSEMELNPVNGTGEDFGGRLPSGMNGKT